MKTNQNSRVSENKPCSTRVLNLVVAGMVPQVLNRNRSIRVVNTGEPQPRLHKALRRLTAHGVDRLRVFGEQIKLPYQLLRLRLWKLRVGRKP